MITSFESHEWFHILQLVKIERFIVLSCYHYYGTIMARMIQNDFVTLWNMHTWWILSSFDLNRYLKIIICYNSHIDKLKILMKQDNFATTFNIPKLL